MRPSSQRRKPLAYARVSHSAATTFVWTAVILNGNDAGGPLINGRAFKLGGVQKCFWRVNTTCLVVGKCQVNTKCWVVGKCQVNSKCQVVGKRLGTFHHAGHLEMVYIFPGAG